MFYVYQLRRADSEVPFYIGKGCGNRMFVHSCPSELQARNMKAAMMRKAKRQGVEVLAEKLHDDIDEDLAHDLEMFWIAFYGRKKDASGVLSNLTGGGEGRVGGTHSEATKQKISASLKGRPNEATRKALTGRKLSEEHRQAISRGMKSRKKDRT